MHTPAAERVRTRVSTNGIFTVHSMQHTAVFTQTKKEGAGTTAHDRAHSQQLRWEQVLV